MSFIKTELEKNSIISRIKIPEYENYDRIFIKRDDLIHPQLSGNKWRKLKYNLIEAKNRNKKTLLTFGGAYSNHIYATAAAGAENGFDTIGIIRGEKHLKLNPTLAFAESKGMELHYLSRSIYKERNNKYFQEELKNKFGDVYIIPEGGSNSFALKGCAEIIEQIEIEFDTICTSCGTGGTLAGILVGLNGTKKAIGFSSLKGGEFLREEINNLTNSFNNNTFHNFIINTSYHFGGYAKISIELNKFIKEFYKLNNIELDYIYTGKMFFGIRELINNGTIKKDEKVIAMHTGGIQGNLGMISKIEKLYKENKKYMNKLNKGSIIGIVGAGTMGAGIAQIAAVNGHKVFLFDLNTEVLNKSKAKLEKILNRLVEKEKYTNEQVVEILNRISFINEIGELKDCNLVIEAIVENLSIKQKVFAELENIVNEECILATNTSSLSITSIASSCKNASRVIGTHFFNPAPLMPLVEIIPAITTNSNVTLNVRNLIDSWGKVTVTAKDTPGFIVNRVARPFYGEALRILEEGIANEATIDWAMKKIGGFKMGPFELMDLIGNDVNYKVTETVFEQFYFDPRFKPSITQKRLVEANMFGRKSGKGFYDYSENAISQKIDENEDLGIEIFFRILVMLINEAADALFMNIASKEDIELAMIKGVNYPKGLLRWADERGIAKVVRRLNMLYEDYGEDRYRVNPLLKRMVKEDKTFF